VGGKKFGTRASVLILIALLCGGAFAANAQTVERIERKEKRVQFPRKRKTAVVKGSVAWGRSDAYKLAARAGQKLTLKLASSNSEVAFIIITPGGQTLEGAFAAREWSGALPEKGDYAITIVNNEKNSSASPYALEVTLK
jgi:hypothetical protein